MTDATKASVFTATYRPFGEVHATSATKANNQRFPGQYFLIETGLAYNWHRHYDPVTGRYTQADPLGLSAGMNRFAYAYNSPFIYRDRDGQCPVCIGMAVGAVAGIAYEIYSHGGWECTSGTDMAFGAAAGAGVGAAVAVAVGVAMEYAAASAAMDTAIAGAGIGVGAETGVGGGLGAAVAESGFGGLSSAPTYGIQSYASLTRALSGTSSVAHHLIEKRFAQLLGENARQMMSIAVSRAEHQIFTNAWRTEIGYGAGTRGATQATVLNAARRVYQTYPAILKGLGL